MNELRQREPRVRDAMHLASVRSKPCCVCGSVRNVEAAHIRMACLVIGKRETGMAEKPDDKWSVPLCAYHHRTGILSQHNIGEEQFWTDHGRNPFEIAASLWIGSGAAERARQPLPTSKVNAIKQTKPRKPRAQRRKIFSNPHIPSRPFPKREGAWS